MRDMSEELTRVAVDAARVAGEDAPGAISGRLAQSPGPRPSTIS